MKEDATLMVTRHATNLLCKRSTLCAMQGYLLKNIITFRDVFPVVLIRM